jgi:hypothetical protein
VVAYVGLFELDVSPLVQLAQDAPAEIYIGDDVSIDTGEAFLGLIDPDFAGQAAEDAQRTAGPSAVLRSGRDDNLKARSLGLGEKSNDGRFPCC